MRLVDNLSNSYRVSWKQKMYWYIIAVSEDIHFEQLIHCICDFRLTSTSDN